VGADEPAESHYALIAFAAGVEVSTRSATPSFPPRLPASAAQESKPDDIRKSMQ
jgi:hypothetical protein